MEVTLRIPSDLEVYFKEVVREKFKGDAEAAVLEAVVSLIERERRQMVDDVKFDAAAEKIRDRHRRKEEIADKEISDAFRKLTEKKKRAADLFAQSFKKPEDSERK
ncbi:hypothetical protein HS125_12625 [bacterium]|nr:hypothetical protein [bacterium]